VQVNVQASGLCLAHQSKSDGHTGAPVFRMSLSGLLCARDLYSVFLGCFVP